MVRGLGSGFANSNPNLTPNLTQTDNLELKVVVLGLLVYSHYLPSQT